MFNKTLNTFWPGLLDLDSKQRRNAFVFNNLRDFCLFSPFVRLLCAIFAGKFGLANFPSGLCALVTCGCWLLTLMLRVLCASNRPRQQRPGRSLLGLSMGTLDVCIGSPLMAAPFGGTIHRIDLLTYCIIGTLQ